MRSKMSAIGTSDSAFHDGNPSTGELGTIVTADWLNAVQASTMDLQDELLNVLAAASIANDPTVKTQILAAINKLSKLNMQSGAATFATDTGVANAYVVSLTPALVAPRGEGQVIRFKVTNPNNGACTVNDGISIVPLVGLALSALKGGEMVAGGEAWIQWHPFVGTGSYVLLFCSGASMQVPAGTKPDHAVNKSQLDAIKSSIYVTVSLSGGAMTFTLPKQLLKFRNPSLTAGDTVEITPAADLTLTIPNTATLGTINAQLANLIPIIFYNAGTPVLGVVNLASGLDLSEAGLLSATAISDSADSASIAYASLAVTGSPYIVAGLVQSTQVTAGTWLTAPSVIPKSTNLAAMLGGVGFYQPVDVTASRAFGTTYYNSTGRPKKVKVVAMLLTINGFILNMSVNGVIVDSNGYGGSSTAVTRYFSVEWIVPPGGSYLVSWTTSAPTIVEWIEA